MVAAYGSAVTSDWRTTGICFDTVSLDIDIDTIATRSISIVNKKGDNISGVDGWHLGQCEAPVRWEL